jgi:NAD(P)-dependent dehydrogenase (short-subunit alcohol dehydrogenase family)
MIGLSQKTPGVLPRDRAPSRLIAAAVQADCRRPDVPFPSGMPALRAAPLGRNAEPEDVAGAILVVAADTSGFMPARGGSLML